MDIGAIQDSMANYLPLVAKPDPRNHAGTRSWPDRKDN